jgi:hypothetical protein
VTNKIILIKLTQTNLAVAEEAVAIITKPENGIIEEQEPII